MRWAPAFQLATRPAGSSRKMAESVTASTSRRKRASPWGGPPAGVNGGCSVAMGGLREGVGVRGGLGEVGRGDGPGHAAMVERPAPLSTACRGRRGGTIRDSQAKRRGSNCPRAGSSKREGEERQKDTVRDAAMSQMNGVIQHLRRAVLLQDGAGLTDEELLTHYIGCHDEAALATLVRRH